MQVDSFCLNPFSPIQNDAVSLIISGKRVQDFYILCHLTFIKRKARQKSLSPHLGKGKLVRIIGRFQTSSVKLHRLLGKVKLSLARIIGNFEKPRIGEMVIPLYLSVQTLVELAQKLLCSCFLFFVRFSLIMVNIFPIHFRIPILVFFFSSQAWQTTLNHRKETFLTTTTTKFIKTWLIRWHITT